MEMTTADTERRNRLLAETEFIVEATSNEVLNLWERYSDQADQSLCRTPGQKYRWEQQNPGYLITVGQLDGRPICIHLRWSRIDGVLVLFWEATSQVVDRKRIDRWFRENCYPRYDQGRPAKVDAMNFHAAIHYIEEKCRSDGSPPHRR